MPAASLDKSDATGLAVVNATVTATNRDTNVSVRVVTGDDSPYVATALRIGVYKVQLEAKGFKKAVRDEIPLASGAGPPAR